MIPGARADHRAVEQNRYDGHGNSVSEPRDELGLRGGQVDVPTVEMLDFRAWRKAEEHDDEVGVPRGAQRLGGESTGGPGAVRSAALAAERVARREADARGRQRRREPVKRDVGAQRRDLGLPRP